MALLTDDQVAEALASLPEWTRQGNRIERQLVFPSFADAVAANESVSPTTASMARPRLLENSFMDSSLLETGMFRRLREASLTNR